MALNLGKKLSTLFAGLSGQDNQPVQGTYAKASPEQRAEYDACLERFVAASTAIKTIHSSPEYKASPYADGEYALRNQHKKIDDLVRLATEFKNGTKGYAYAFPDMTEAINGLGEIAEGSEQRHKSLTENVSSRATKTAAPAKPAQP